MWTLSPSVFQTRTMSILYVKLNKSNIDVQTNIEIIQPRQVLWILPVPIQEDLHAHWDYHQQSQDSFHTILYLIQGQH